MVRVLLLLAALLPGLAQTATAEEPRQAVAAVLNTLHQKASEADYDGYFALFSEHAVFLGTDREEYWPIDTFKAYTRERFATGAGWTYHPIERFVHVNGDTAWFEERLHHARYGETRGTGVLVRKHGAWRVAQYNLTLPIPNDLFVDVAEAIKNHYDDTGPETDE